ncbi:hypothetical protein IFM89_002448 [Coptis chinensis]|uniref:Uncharacterized protein n=1 Tax=Coptis chinensis TaxID=261450 RepID=A0A835ILH6_9MAGN|nr:hypothetical protein IFM89_002448 [Coptis chinensis]
MEVEVNKTTNNEDEDNMTLAKLCTRKSSIHLPMVVSDQPGTPSSYKRKQALLDDDKTMRCPKERAEEVRANLDPEFPSFVKTMLPSHISGGFWWEFLHGLRKSHLPKMDATMTLVNENRKEYPTRYTLRKDWIKRWVEGLLLLMSWLRSLPLVFQLVEATKFQVYFEKLFVKPYA